MQEREGLLGPQGRSCGSAVDGPIPGAIPKTSAGVEGSCHSSLFALFLVAAVSWISMLRAFPLTQTDTEVSPVISCPRFSTERLLSSPAPFPTVLAKPGLALG